MHFLFGDSCSLGVTPSRLVIQLTTLSKASKLDFAAIRKVLHKLKGSSSTFGASKVELICENLREQCIASESEPIREGSSSIEALAAEVEILKVTLKKYIDISMKFGNKTPASN